MQQRTLSKQTIHKEESCQSRSEALRKPENQSQLARTVRLHNHHHHQQQQQQKKCQKNAKPILGRRGQDLTVPQA
jgi:hypothetical protein